MRALAFCKLIVELTSARPPHLMRLNRNLVDRGRYTISIQTAVCSGRAINQPTASITCHPGMNLQTAQKERRQWKTPFIFCRWRLLARPVSLALLGMAVLAFPGHASEGGYHPPATAHSDYDAVALDNPSDAILLIFNHGSGAEFTPDQCKGVKGVPQVIRKLEGRRLADKQVIVYAFCTPSRVGEYNHNSRTGEPKVVKRALDIEQLVGRFTVAGLPSRSIFLVGHGAGAWASLLVGRRGNVDINAVIGFGPAFAGRKVTRSEGWWDLHRKQSEYLRTAPRLDAMVFAFEGDRYSDVSELESTFSATGVEFVPVTEEAGNNAGCKLSANRNGAFSKCFGQFAEQRISAFIEERLRNTDLVTTKGYKPPHRPDASANDAVSPETQKSPVVADKSVTAAVTPGDPSDDILLVYSPGSGPEFVPDRCNSNDDVPDVVRSLEERRIAGRTVRVFAFCGPSRVGEYVHELLSGEPKVAKRARDIEDLVDRLTAAGLSGRNIFLVGHSAGAWASLLVARGGNVDVNAVIGFAPAFAGPQATRPPGWSDLHREQSAYLQTAASLDALIFAFEGDRYAEVSDLELVVSAPGIDFVRVSRWAYDDFTCKLTAPHRSAFTQCFEDFAAPRIRTFIEQRLRNTNAGVASAETLLSLNFIFDRPAIFDRP